MTDRPTGSAALLDPHRLLGEGRLEVLGRVVEASNTTLYCRVALDGRAAACVYKPVAGERPLWDFPDGTLAHREVAAYLVSAATGWGLVPPTVLRDGPLGPGMCQLWVDADETVDVVALVRRNDPRLRRVAVFDALVNNADRKGGHLLPAPGGQVYGVDHGVCFAVEDKLRTVLWGWAGRPLTAEAAEVVARVRRELDAGLGAGLGRLLSAAEVEATRRRAGRLLATGVHPEPTGEWPPVPWPLF